MITHERDDQKSIKACITNLSLTPEWRSEGRVIMWELLNEMMAIQKMEMDETRTVKLKLTISDPEPIKHLLTHE